MLDFIQDILIRQWNDLLARPSGPMGFRFVLQPVMAAIAGIRAGIVDARTGRSPYFLYDPHQQGQTRPAHPRRVGIDVAHHDSRTW